VQRVALALGGVLIAIALGIGIPALVDHARERAAWAAERAEQGTDDYDPRLSDRHYRASRDAWQRSEPAGHLLGAGLLLFTLGALRRRGTDSGRRTPTAGPRLRRIAALAIDLALTAGVLALHWLDAGESAAVRALTHTVLWLAALPLASRLTGRSPGQRATIERTTGAPPKKRAGSPD